MERLPMIGLTLTQDFLSTPPPFFQVHCGIGDPSIKHDRSQVTVCVSSTKHKNWFPDSMGSVLKVTSDSDYENLVQGLLSRPLFLDVALERFTAPACENYQKTTKADMFVTVNTAHPVIKSQLLKVIDEGRTLIRAGKKFAMKITFNGVLKDWFRSLLAGDEGLLSCLNTVAFAENASIVITNTSEFFEPYGCNPSLICCTICCLPCCLLTCPLYRLHRILTTTDRKVKIQGEIQYLNWVDGVPHAQSNCQFIMHQEVRRRGIYSGSTNAV